MNLKIWTIYNNPMDFPGKFVCRRFEYDQPTDDFFVAETLDEVRDYIMTRFDYMPTCISRQFGDDPVIVETWL